MDRDWKATADAINSQLGLRGDSALRPSIAGLPPIWFQGDVERIQPGEWVLVMSLNHQVASDDEYADVTRDTLWDLQRLHDRDHWYEAFNGPLARVAATAMGMNPDDIDVAAYASEHVVFTELCPYASKSFALDANTIAHLVKIDPAFQTAAWVRRILLEHARPSLVLVNGSGGLESFAVVYREQFEWQSPAREYLSVDDPQPGRLRRRLWHQEGVYRATAGLIPVIGFPFLRKPRTHNSYCELAQLGQMARDFRQFQHQDKH